MSLEEPGNILKTYSLKVTHPRLTVLDILLSSVDHPSAEKIFDKIKLNNPSISLGTVYRVLETFEQHDIIKRVATRGNITRYEINKDTHYHIYCKDTNDLIDFYDTELEELLKNYFSDKRIENFGLDEIKIQLNGKKLDQSKKTYYKPNK